MSKVLRIQEGGYKIITEPGKEIKLDTGSSGQVRVTGDLIVEGEQTFLQTQILEVEDRVVIINRAPTGSPASLQEFILPFGDDREAGLEIQRGLAPAVRIVLDDDLTYDPPNENTGRRGLIAFRNTLNQPVGLYTDYIKSPAGDMHFNIGVDGVLSVRTDPGPFSLPYHQRINDNDDIPNLKYIREYVRAEAGQAVIEKFFRFANNGLGDSVSTKTGARALDVINPSDDLTGIFFTIGSGPIASRTDKEVAAIDSNGLFIGNKFNNNSTHLKLYVNEAVNTSTISTDKSDINITPETGKIRLKDKIYIDIISALETNPVPEINTNIVYARNDQGAGGTGIYFSNTTTQGEVCSAAKALVYGLIF